MGGIAVAAALMAVSAWPGAWMASAEPPPVLPTPGALGGLWDAATLWLPVGERGARAGLAALLLALAVSAGAGWLASHLYRGTGRGAASFAAVPVCAALLLAWLREPGAELPGALAAGLVAVLALGLVVGARVRRSGGASAGLAGGVLALAGALGWPRGGALCAALVLGSLGWNRGSGRWRAVLGAGLGFAPLLLFGTGLFQHDLNDISWTGGWSQLGLALRVAGAALLFPALALLVLLVWPLRWRGGGLLLGLALSGLALPVVAAPLWVVLVSVAVCGWIWLAGSVGGRWGARAAAVVVLAIAGARVVLAPGPVAATRPELSLLALHQRGLVAPGDVLLAHDLWLALAFAAARRDEGLRPDVELYAATSLDPAGLERRLARWSREGRRVLSDSFNDGGRWPAAGSLDSGPLFWRVEAPADVERSFTDLRGFSPAPELRLPAYEAARWERLHVERARHRRALGEHQQALLALPLADGELELLTQRLRRSELSRLPASGSSEIGALASAHAEAGDLLFALGDGDEGAAQLAAAAERGVAEALGALVRWRLRAGEETAAGASLRVLAGAPVLRPQLLAVGWWLLGRARVQEAAALLAAAPPAPGFAAEELALRLATLRGLAAP